MSTNKEIIEILKYLKTSGLNEVEIKTKNYEIKVKRKTEKHYLQQANNPSPCLITPPPGQPTTTAVEHKKIEEIASGNESKHKTNTSDDKNLVELKSPMIGTFYRAQNPETPSFVELGDTVKKSDTICIIEAMKLFNEIEAEHSGKIVKILVENASPVEYGQPLFLIEPL